MNSRKCTIAILCVTALCISCFNDPQSVNDSDLLQKKTYRYNAEVLEVFYDNSKGEEVIIPSAAYQRVLEIGSNPEAGVAPDPIDSNIAWLYTNESEWKDVINSCKLRGAQKRVLAKTTSPTYGSKPILYEHANYSGCALVVDDRYYPQLKEAWTTCGPYNFDDKCSSIRTFTDGRYNYAVRVHEDENLKGNNATLHPGTSYSTLKGKWIFWPFKDWNDRVSSAQWFLE